MLEVGLGGRLDVVNVVDPDVAVITNIGLDHIDWLGDTIEKLLLKKQGLSDQIFLSFWWFTVTSACYSK